MSGFPKRVAQKFFFLLFPMLFFTATLISPFEVLGQVVINEVLPNPKGEEAGSEWVELYNLINSPASLAGCILRLHATDNSQLIELGEEDFIDKYKVVSWDKTWLSNAGDTIRLVCPNFSDSVAYGEGEGSVVERPSEGVTFGRNPDGTGGFSTLSSPTLGEPNSGPPLPTPDPTWVNTSTPKPTNTIPPTKLPTKTPTPHVILSTATASSTPTLTVINNKVTEPNTPEAKTLGAKVQADTEFKKNFNIIALFFIITGLGFMGVPFFLFLKSKRKL